MKEIHCELISKQSVLLRERERERERERFGWRERKRPLSYGEHTKTKPICPKTVLKLHHNVPAMKGNTL